MNRSLSDLPISSFNDVDHLQIYETCRKQSACYLLAPPPRPPTIPELFLTATCKLSSTSPSILTNLRQRPTDSSYLTIISIILGIFIALTSTCLILFLLGVKFRFYHKLRYRHRRTTTGTDSVNSSIRETNNSDVAFIKTTTTNSGHLIGNNSSVGIVVGVGGGGSSSSGDGCASFSSVIPTSYDCFTPVTTTTIAHNQYPSLSIKNNSNLSLHMTHSRQHLNSEETASSHVESTNIYEEIRPTFDRHHHCCCCSCTLTHYQQQQQQHQPPYLSTNRQSTPHYYTCEPPNLSVPSTVVCQSCLLETLHRKQHTNSTMTCACRNFFVPIK